MIQWIRTHRSGLIETVVGLTILDLVYVSKDWWGERALGVFIGVVVLTLTREVYVRYNFKPSFAWVTIVVALWTGLVVRLISGPALGTPIHIQPLSAPPPQIIFYILIAALLVVLLTGFARSLGRGEGVGVESHWGGLGGGISGFQVSTPMVYLLGIILLLAIACAVAWRAYPPPAAASSTPTPSPTASPTASPTPSPAASSIP